METHTATFGVFYNSSQVQTALNLLRQFGFQNTHITVLYPDQEGAQDFAQVQKPQWKKGALIGAGVGAIVVFALALFIAGKFFTSTTNPLFFGVSETTVLFASLALGAIAGAAVGTLVGIGTPSPAAKRYGRYLHVGGILMSVRSDKRELATKAHEALELAGGQDIHALNEDDSWKTAIHEKQESDYEEAMDKLDEIHTKEL